MPPFYWQHTPNLLNYGRGVQKKAPKLCPATCSVQQHIFIALHEPLKKKKASGS